MKQTAAFVCIVFLLSISAKAQPSIKLDYFTKVPDSMKDCGTTYTYDTVALQKKKYILLTDFQNQGLLMVNGKQIKLELTNSKTVNKSNIATYEGAGYTIIVMYKTTAQKDKWDVETGTLQLQKGTMKSTIKIHGQYHCDESKQEGNS